MFSSSLYCTSFSQLQLLITSLICFRFFCSLGHYIVRPSPNYGFWLHLWYLFVLFVLLVIILYVLPITASDYIFDIFSFCLFSWSLYCTSFSQLQLLITSLISVRSFCSLGHYFVRPSPNYSFWLDLWYLFFLFVLLVIILYVLLPITAFDYIFDIFSFFLFSWSLYCTSFSQLQLLITSLISFLSVCSLGHYIVRPSPNYSFWLHLWYLFFVCSLGHYIVRPSPNNGFWLHLWYLFVLFVLLVIILYVLLPITASDYIFDIFSFCLFSWSLYCTSFSQLRLLITSLISFRSFCSLGHYIVHPSPNYGFWLHLWYLFFLFVLLVIILYVLLPITASDYIFDIFSFFLFSWSLYCTSFAQLQLLITSLISFCSLGHYMVRPSPNYSFWLHLWYIFVLLVIILYVIVPITASDYIFDICSLFLFSWSLYGTSFSQLQLLITSLISVRSFCSLGHYIVRPSPNYSLWLHLWYLFVLLVIILYVLLPITASDYIFDIFSFFLFSWSLYCTSFSQLQLLITSLISFLSVCSLGHYIVRHSPNYGFWLHLWYLFVLFVLLVIILYILLPITASDYIFDIFSFFLFSWSLYCTSFSQLQLLITSLISFRSFCSLGHYIVRPSPNYSFWLHLWYLFVLLVIIWYVLLPITASDYIFDIFSFSWSLYCTSLSQLQLLITSLISVRSFCSLGHYMVRPSPNYSFWLHLWYLFVLFVLLVIIWYVLLPITASDYIFDIFLFSWSLYCTSFSQLQLLITSLISFRSFCSLGHYIVRPSPNYSFWLHLWYLFVLFVLLVIILYVLLPITASDYIFDIFSFFLFSWSLYGTSFAQLQLLITSLISFRSFCSLGHYIVRPSPNYSFWLHLWYLFVLFVLLVIILYVLLPITASDYIFGIFSFFLFSWSLYCTSFSQLQLLITSLISFCSLGHYIVRPSPNYSFWLHLWYLFVLLVIILYVLLPITASDYIFDIFSFFLFSWSLYCTSFSQLRLLITSLISFRSFCSLGHYIVRPSPNYSFWLHLWYLFVLFVLLVIIWYVLRPITASDYIFDIFSFFLFSWSLYCTSFSQLQLLITSLISFRSFCSLGHYIVRPSPNYSFWLHLWYLFVLFVLLVIIWYVLRPITASDYIFDIFSFFLFSWSLYCTSFSQLQLLITSLISFRSFCSLGHYIVRPSPNYSFWLHLWYLFVLFVLLVIILYVLLPITASDYIFDIFLFSWSLYCTSFSQLQLLITSLISFCSLGHYIVRPSPNYSLWLHLWYLFVLFVLLVIILYVLLPITASDYIFDIFSFFLFSWSLYCTSFSQLQLLITSLISFRSFCSLGHYMVRPSPNYSFWLHLWYLFVLFVLLVIILYVLLPITASDYIFDIFSFFLFSWSLYCTSFSQLQLLITSLISFRSFCSLGHYIVRPSPNYSFWLHLWYLFVLFVLLVIIVYVLLPITASDYIFDIFSFCLFSWSLYCTSFSQLQLLITSLISFRSFCSLGHYMVRPSPNYSFWLHLWYLFVLFVLLVIILYVLLPITAYDYIFDIFSFFLFSWSLYGTSFSQLQLMITSLISFRSFCSSPNYSLWLHLWYLFVLFVLLLIILYVLRPITASDYIFDIFSFFLFSWSLYCTSFSQLQLLITSLISFRSFCSLGHYSVRPSPNYSFWLHLWYLFFLFVLLVIILYVLLPITASDYIFGIFKFFWHRRLIYN